MLGGIVPLSANIGPEVVRCGPTLTESGRIRRKFARVEFKYIEATPDGGKTMNYSGTLVEQSGENKSSTTLPPPPKLAILVGNAIACNRVAQVKFLDPSLEFYLNNCEEGLHGPIEVIPNGGMEVFAGGIGTCIENASLLKERDTWGEDVFLRLRWANVAGIVTARHSTIHNLGE